MGMRGFGEIARLCTVAPPTIGIVTAVAAAHTARLGGIDGVARAKAELVEALPAHGVAILNADDERVRAMASLDERRARSRSASRRTPTSASTTSSSTSWPGRRSVCARRGGARPSGSAPAVGT